MTRNLRQEIIATPATGMGDGNHTTGRSGQYLAIYVNNKYLGGMQSIDYEEVGGVLFQRQIGNRFNEPNPQPYEVQGTFTRFQIRGKTLRQLMAQIYDTVSGINWSELPFDIRMHQWYTSASGGTYFENTWETVKDVWVQNIRVSQPDPTSNRLETVTFIARAIIEQGDNITTLQSVPNYELGGAFPNLNAKGH